VLFFTSGPKIIIYINILKKTFAMLIYPEDYKLTSDKYLTVTIAYDRKLKTNICVKCISHGIRM